MKLFAMTAINGDPIPETCLCLDHFDKRSTVKAPYGTRPDGWTEKTTTPGLKCIWCGATADKSEDIPLEETLFQIAKRFADIDMNEGLVHPASALGRMIVAARELIASSPSNKTDTWNSLSH